MDDKAELVAFARESAKAGVDLYDLLGVDGTTSRDDIHRAWRRKGLKYHPDKAGDNYDPTLYERFMRARDVLVDDDARVVYDTGRAAEAQRKMASEQMSAERRRFKDELEAAEKAHDASTNLTPFGAPSTTSAPESTEHEKLREAGRRRAEERTRREQEAQDRVRQREDDRILEIERRLRDKEDKAKRRADKKRDEDPAATKPAPSASATSKKPPPASIEAEWKRLLQKGSAKKEGGDKPAVDRKTQLFAETMARLAAAGRAQRQREKDAAAAAKAPAAPAPSTATADPITADPITADPITTDPITADPTTADPATADPTTADPTAADPATADPTTADPTAADPTAADPTAADPTAADPTAADPTAADPTAADPTAADPTAADPTAADPTASPTTVAPVPEVTELRATVEPVSDIGDNNSVVELFEPQWEAVDDPEVSQFIKRVPKFTSTSSTIAGDMPMETVG